MKTVWGAARLFVVVASTIATVTIVVHGTVIATHSTPSPYLYFWDCNNDGVPDDGCALFRPSGGGWTTAALERLNAAFYTWRAATDYDPYTNNNANGDIWKDREVDHPGCAGWPTWEEWWEIQHIEYFAVACIVKAYHGAASPPYYRIGSNTDIFINPSPAQHTWWISGASPASPSYVDFGGVLIHELGHTVMLNDLYCSPGYTMCGQMDWISSFNARTLMADDIAAANGIYP